MAYQIYTSRDWRDNQPSWIPDEGENGRGYPISDRPDNTDLIMDNMIQHTVYNQATAVAMFSDWIQSFFPNNYFKFVKIRTQVPFQDWKSFMPTIYKKEKPFMIIDPSTPEIVEDFILAQNMLGRYNYVDPNTDRVSAKMMYAVPIMGDELFQLHYRRNRVRMGFDIMIMEQTMNRQQDTFNMLVANIRHNSKFTLQKVVPFLIPSRYIRNIATFWGLDYRSDEFIAKLNSVSHFPIRKEIRTTGQIMFFMLQELHCHVEVPGYPDKDTPEKSEAIEWGARVVDRFIFQCDLPMEFLFLLTRESVDRFDRGIEDDPENITFISPVYADLNWPEAFGDYRVTNRLDVSVEDGDDPKVQVLPFIRDYDGGMYDVITEWIAAGGHIDDLLQVHVYPNGEYRETGSVLHQDGVVELLSPTVNKLYTINLYVNTRAVNLIREGRAKRHIGTIEVDKLSE